MKLYSGAEIILVIIATAALIGYFSSRFLGDDNAVEETAEMIIEKHTGIDLDLSPDSPE